MKRYLLILGLLLGSSATLTSCEKFLDVNTDPNNPTTSTPNYLLPGIISQGIQAQMFTSLTTTYISQYTVRKSPASSTDQFTLSNGNSTNTFNYNYYYSGGNIPTMTAAAEQEGSPYYIGAGKIIQAMDLAHATDMLGDIPYTEAYQGAANYTPKYDPQEQIYQTIQTLCDEGIALMQTPADKNFRPLYVTSPSISGDILFKGDVQKWIKFANGLKARQLNHLIKKKGVYNPQQILALIDKSMTSSADDAQLQYQLAVAPLTGTTNIFGTTRNNYATATFSSNIIKYLNGSVAGATYPGVSDPRLPIMATTTSTGADPGVTSTGNVVNGFTDFYSSWYARDLGYFEVLTYHELKFIEAEAAFNAGDKARALRAYQEGIRAHMQKIGVGGTNANPPVTFPVISQAQIDAYLSSAAVAQTPADLTIKRIMEQKYIAMFLNPESWSDLRRYDFDPTIYVNLKYPNNANATLAAKVDYKDRWPRRMLPGATEVLYNPQAVAKLFAEAGATSNDDYITKPLWWDRP
ncbi:SusD/RagB family nutrient-binding outer membrane lipoprotein [Hymenobacter taeanensis]|uniref:SusD/RagB family nutrient-binding outer membrane lipoprotein n=1 Tax=Hymenobacter taeanensis TaxID=2735321 RepID=A0A6M6BBR0_9BACT|nr:MULTISPECIES: SusD/RagB family nutrient-binding outer membrane lipoprotein [Hymenobacter]QJX45646.1 SusD/RagB family nutrient-binding outer membrane lipoprotein [Hymenobacter taeanensis]UOQ79482.1 SusD/RagB family nutrient-binding outer membrane lipoprotein [Hymenobacter sp. 5414T-23]